MELRFQYKTPNVTASNSSNILSSFFNISVKFPYLQSVATIKKVGTTRMKGFVN